MKRFPQIEKVFKKQNEWANYNSLKSSLNQEAAYAGSDILEDLLFSKMISALDKRGKKLLFKEPIYSCLMDIAKIGFGAIHLQMGNYEKNPTINNTFSENAARCYWDPRSKSRFKEDGGYCGVTNYMSEEELRLRYPNFFGLRSLSFSNSINELIVPITTHYEREYKEGRFMTKCYICKYIYSSGFLLERRELNTDQLPIYYFEDLMDLSYFLFINNLIEADSQGYFSTLKKLVDVNKETHLKELLISNMKKNPVATLELIKEDIQNYLQCNTCSNYEE